MFIALVIIANVLALMLIMSAQAKLSYNEQVVTTITGLGVPRTWFPWLATVDLAGAFGLVAGLVFAPLGVLACGCVLVYFICAIATHLRAGDKAILLPAILAVLAAAALVLRVLTL